MRFILPALVSPGHSSAGWSFQIWKGKKKRNWILANSGDPGSSGWAHTLLPTSWGQWLCPLQCGSASPQPENTQSALRPPAVQSCPQTAIPAEMHSGCDCRTCCMALPRLHCHLIWTTGNCRPTVIPMSAEKLPGDNSLLQLFSLPWRGSDLQTNLTSKTAIKDRHAQPSGKACGGSGCTPPWDGSWEIK